MGGLYLSPGNSKVSRYALTNCENARFCNGYSIFASVAPQRPQEPCGFLGIRRLTFGECDRTIFLPLRHCKQAKTGGAAAD